MRFLDLFKRKIKKDSDTNLLNSTDVQEQPLVDLETLPVASEIQTTINENVSTFQIVKTLSSVFLAKENLPRLTLATLLTIVNTGVNFLSPYFLGETIKLMSSEDDTVNIGGIEFTQTALIAALVASYSLAQILPNIRDQIMTPVNSNNTKKMLLKGTDHLLKKSLNYQVNTAFPDQVYFLQKNFAVSSLGGPLLTQISPTLIEIMIACSVLSSRYGIEMGAGLFGLMLGYAGYSAATAKPIINAKETSLQAGNAGYENFCNAIAQYKNMYDFGKYDTTIKEVDAALERMIKADINANLKPLQFGVGHIGISRASMLMALIYVGANVQSGKFSVEDFILLAGYLHQLSGLLPAFGQAINQLFASFPDMRFVCGELAKPDEVVDHHPDVYLDVRQGEAPSIEFENVSFTHPKKPNEAAKPALFSNLSFKIAPGQKVALVSESGAGKSTIFNLLYGYYTPTSGVIKINGQDISTVSIRDLRKNIGLMGQTPNLFKGNVRDNILYGAEMPSEITDEDIYQMAKDINLYDFLQSLSNQLDTDVGEGGKKLSGGEQHKVAILRGLFKKVNIRLLDEITAPFDSTSATKVLEKLDLLLEQTTSIMITHKLTEAKFADQIIVIHKGSAIACGRHQELLENCELYQKLWKAYLKDETKTDTNLNSDNVNTVTKMGITAAWNDKNEINKEEEQTLTLMEHEYEKDRQENRMTK